MKLRILAWLPLFLTVAAAGVYGVVHAFTGETEAIQAGNEDTAEPEPEAEAQPDPPKQKDADYVAFEGGLRAYPAKRVVEMDAWLLGSQTRPLEYLLVSPGGNTHESLFASAGSGLHLKRALEIVGLAEGKEKRSGRGYLDKPVGDRVKISVRFFHSKTGKETVVPVEDWLWDHQNNAHPDKVGFIFTGSFEQFRAELNRSLFEADMKGNLIAMWRDSACVLDNDRDDGYVPDIYSPYPEADGIPQTVRGVTPQVTLLFEPWPEEKKEEKKD
ncbi:MAG: hypothetical protein H6839_09435 [Planctomycetes bacterium]|nr:hypothetical protein [Planctomycetota bacterium]